MFENSTDLFARWESPVPLMQEQVPYYKCLVRGDVGLTSEFCRSVDPTKKTNELIYTLENGRLDFHQAHRRALLKDSSLFFNAHADLVLFDATRLMREADVPALLLWLREMVQQVLTFAPRSCQKWVLGVCSYDQMDALLPLIQNFEQDPFFRSLGIQLQLMAASAEAHRELAFEIFHSLEEQSQTDEDDDEELDDDSFSLENTNDEEPSAPQLATGLDLYDPAEAGDCNIL